MPFVVLEGGQALVSGVFQGGTEYDGERWADASAYITGKAVEVDLYAIGIARDRHSEDGWAAAFTIAHSLE